MSDIVSKIRDRCHSISDASFPTVGNALTWINQFNILLKEYIKTDSIQYRLFRKYFGDNIEQIGIPVEIHDRLTDILDLVNPSAEYKIKSIDDKVCREGQIGDVKMNIEYPCISYSIVLVDSLETILSKLDNIIDGAVKCVLPQYLKPGVSIEQLIKELHQLVKFSSKSEDVVSYSHDICDFLSSNFDVSIIDVKDPDVDEFNPDWFEFSTNPNIEKSIMTIPAIVKNNTSAVLCKGRIVKGGTQHDN